MKEDLAQIKEFVQQVAEATSTIIGVEVMVFDVNRDIVAGSGKTKIEVGSRYCSGSLTGRLLAGGQPLISRQPGRSAECSPCSGYGKCPFHMVIAYPVRVDGKTIGSFCLAATDGDQKRHVLANEQNLLRFLDQMCLLIGSAIGEKKIQDEMGVLIKRYNSVVNSVHEGIIATDHTGRIIHFNLSAAKLMGIRPDQALGAPLDELLPDLGPVDGNRTVETETCFYHNGKKRYFLATVVPVQPEDNGAARGMTISLRKLSEVHSYAARLMVDYNQYGFDDILGVSDGILQVKEKLSKVATTDSTILIRGESGTGKELFAHAVYSASHRARGPFVAINCSAIPESLLESELFGYEEGAFTGAKRGGKPGKFELAEGGILFLDEIGDMPQHLQSKLLRVLENRRIERVGGTESIPINVRIIAATNRNLEEMVERREFRSDLYYRLSVIPVFIPPLRERPEDIPVLIDYFLEKYSKKLDRNRQRLDAATGRRLIEYSWPGNVRELQNAIEYAVNMSEPEQVITLDHLPQRITSAAGEKREVSPRPPGPDPAEKAQVPPGEKNPRPKPQPCNLRDLEAEAIREALSRFGQTTAGKERAASHLGISLATLYRRLKAIEKG